jgi:multicomponent Na+:H+ antiporter subunit D
MTESVMGLSAWLPPGLLLVLGALLVPLLPKDAKAPFMLLLPLLGLAQVWLLPLGFTHDLALFGDLTLQTVRVDGLSRIFGTIFHIAAFVSILYALHQDDDLQFMAGIAYAGAAIAAVFAGDLITLFVYWELTAVTSVFLIWARRTEQATRVAQRYLVAQVLSGVLLLAGAVIRYQDTGSIAFVKMELGDLATWLIFLGFGIKAAFPLLHTWMKDAYPEATVSGSVFLSAFTTKLAIYSLARGFAGTELLIPIGVTMTAFPIFFAVIENDLRRVLSYSLNNQLGFMVAGIGIGTELAINGTAAHAFAHILYKGLLFMSMGAVLHKAGTIKASELGGLWRKMPWTTAFCIVGSLSISAFPLFSGFVSKSMILTAAAEGHHTIAFLVLLFASAGVCDHSGIKIPFFAFFAHNSKASELVKGEAPRSMLLAMGIVASLCIGIGVYPQPLYAMLPYDIGDYWPYDITHVVTQLQLLLFSALAFVFLQKVRLYPPELRSTVLDVDWLVRKPVAAVARWTTNESLVFITAMKEQAEANWGSLRGYLNRVAGPAGRWGEPWASGTTAMWTAIVLAGFLVIQFLR